MQKIRLAPNREISRLVHGHWRLRDWKLSSQQLLELTEQAIETGITTFDHADIYGNYTCEEKFGDALSLKKELRGQIQIVTKCGIKMRSDKYPDRKLQHYDYSAAEIIATAERSLANFRTDFIDLLLLHRPSPFINPAEVAEAFRHLKKQGKVLCFGVSNFNPQQYAMLNAYLDDKLATNQVELSPWCLEHFNNGNMDFFLEQKIKPMAWSPLAVGELFAPKNEKAQRIHSALAQVAQELNCSTIDKVIYAWLLKHPSCIIPIAGTGKIERLRLAAEALDMEMGLQQWFSIYTASTGKPMP
jgi:predicted oxidoreductase